MKTTIYLIAFISLFSCKNTEEKTEIKEETNKILPTETSETKLNVTEENIEEDSKNDFEILLPTQYRDWENKNEVDNLSNDWFDLHIKDGVYYLDKPNYKVERGYSECSGDSTKIIHSKNKTILLINDLSLKLGEVNSLKIKKNKIWPNEKLTIKFGSIEYTLRAEGKIISSEKVNTDNGEELYQKVENYKLYISTNNSNETLFLKQESFNDTFVEILFIGDIDRDGKADFIFGTNRHYEEERVFLYLSSKAKNRQIIKKVSEIAVHFDC